VNHGSDESPVGPDPPRERTVDTPRGPAGAPADVPARSSAESTTPAELAALRARVATLEARLAASRRRRREAQVACDHLTAVLESISDAFVALDTEWRYTYVNERAGRMFGRDPASLVGKHIWTEFPEGVGQPFHLAYERAVAEGRPLQIEAYYPPYRRWFENRIYPHAGGLAIFFQDVTERRLAEVRLRESEAQYRALVEQTIAGVFMIQHGRFTYVNPRFAEMLGYAADELYALPSTLDVVHPDDRDFLAERLRLRLAGQSVPPSRFRMVRKDGSILAAEAHSRVAQLQSGPALIGFQIDVTERVRAEAELHRSEARFRAMIENSSDAITIVDAAGIIRYASPSYERVYGYRTEERVGASAFERIHPDDAPRAAAAFRDLVGRPGGTTYTELRLRNRDGSWCHIAVIAHNLLHEPAVGGVVINTRDMTERVEMEAALRASEERYRAVFASAGVGVARIALDGRWLEVNPRACEITGYAEAELVGRPWTEITHPDEQERAAAHSRQLAISGRVSFSVEKRFVRRDGGVVWVNLTCTVVRDGGGAPDSLVLVLDDITERRTMEARLRELAFHDPLTGLANRALFLDRVAHAFERARREGVTAAVLFLDLDDFKRVNDSLGHAAGDELLVAAAVRLRQTVRLSDTAARLGGDEFAVLVEDAHARADAADLAGRLAEAFRLPFAVGRREIVSGASIGVAIAQPGETPDEVLRNADVAMYVAKAHGRGSFELFAPGMHAAVVARVELEADLRRALDAARDAPLTGELQLAFQPIVELATRRVVGAEALLRWHHATRGDVAPESFIPVAEETGLIVPLGRLVLREACRAAARWAHARGEAPTAGPALTVNVSARQLADATFAEDVRAALADSGLAPARLVLELTESVLIHHAPEIGERLLALQALGTRLAVDDFGTGYSSLGYLQRFPLDVLKVDRSFVRALGTAAPDAAIARAVVALGQALGLETVAEGVESAQQADVLQSMGCSAAQGYFFGAPMPARELERLAGFSRASATAEGGGAP